MSISLLSALSPISAAASSLGLTSTKPKTMADNPTTPSTGSGSSSEGGMDATNLGSTFLQLLGQELQNQDPTQPMSPTDEVSQMISLNQLDQLISINDVISGTSKASTSSTSGAGSGSAAGGASGAGSGSHNGLTKAQADQTNDATAAAQKLAATGVNSSTQPLDLGTLMSLYGGK